MRLSLLVLLAACFAPSPQPGAPCADGVCPEPLVCSAATNTCERVNAEVDADVSVEDAAVVDAPGDAAVMQGCSPCAPNDHYTLLTNLR